MADGSIRWGVLGGTSRIYHGRLRPPMVDGPRHEVVAEASRSADGGTQPYADLLARDDVDAVYIPLPNVGHKPWILAALAAGKHVMCEKPLTMSAADTDEVFAAADSAGRVLMEAYMWPHHPRGRALLDIGRDSLGRLIASYGTFSFPLGRDDDHRVDARGGGALFDVGIYCLGPMVLLAPSETRQVSASAIRNQAGVDISMSGLVHLDHELAAHFSVSFDAPHRRSFDLIGSEGVVSFDDHFVPGPEEPSEVVVARRDGSITRVQCDGANAFANMIDHFADVVYGVASPVWGAAQSRLLARWLEAIHRAAA
jgi:predicted dehydrogenase